MRCPDGCLNGQIRMPCSNGNCERGKIINYENIDDARECFACFGRGRKSCHRCGGSGMLSKKSKGFFDSNYRNCPNCSNGEIDCGKCGGTGYLPFVSHKRTVKTCDICNGVGYIEKMCQRCKGRGHVEVERVVTIQNVMNQLNLDIQAWNDCNGAELQLWAYSSRAANQEWRIIPVETEPNLVFILSEMNGKALDLCDGNQEEGASIQIWEHSWVSDNQLWWLDRQEDGSYRIVAYHSGNVLDADRESYNNGAEVHLYNWSRTPNQCWRLRNKK